MASTAKRMFCDRRGATAAIFAIAMPVMVGMGALAVDVGLWTVKKRQAQGVADQAAYSAAVAANADGDGTVQAKAIAADLGLVDGTNGIVITVNNPPTAGSFVGDDGYWEVIVEQPQSMGLAALFFSDAPTARARAVAGAASGGAACIIGLASSGTAVDVGNNSVTNSGCSVYSNANMVMKNGSAIAGTAFVAGTINKQNPNQIAIGHEVIGVTPTPDPYADVPSPSPCTNTASITNGGSYSAGRFCNGIDIRNNASNKTVNLSPGVYYVGKTFRLDNNITVNGNGGVAIVLMPGTTVTLGNGLIFNLKAPTTGDHAGIAIMGRNLGTNILAWNNGTFNIQGALYFPNQELSIKNNFNAALCTQLVALRVSINNNAAMYDECPGSGIRDVGGGEVALLE